MGCRETNASDKAIGDGHASGTNQGITATKVSEDAPSALDHISRHDSEAHNEVTRNVPRVEWKEIQECSKMGRSS